MRCLRSIRRVPGAFALALVLLPWVAATAARADEGELHDAVGRWRHQDVGVFATLYFDDSSVRSGGLRWATQFSRRWAIEAEVERVDVSSDLRFWTVALVGKGYLKAEGRTRVYLSGGVVRFAESTGDVLDGKPRWAIGLGAERYFAGAWYLRPELRWEWLGSDTGVSGGRISLGVGRTF